MDEPADLPFRVGQLAESKSFVEGFRGAWFRCKIKEIRKRKGKIGYTLEFYDFPDEKAEWTELYQVPFIGRKLKMFKKHLMVRPQYPPIYREDEVSDMKSFSEVSVVVGSYKVGNLVDWLEKGCYWTGRVTKVLGNDKVEIELPSPPAGEGSSYDAFCNDLRPALDWSLQVGWTVPTLEANTPSCARLIHPTKQDHVAVSNSESPVTGEGQRAVQAVAGSPLNASISSHVSANSEPSPGRLRARRQAPLKPLETTVSEDMPATNMELDTEKSTSGKASSSASISAPHVGDAVAETSGDASTEDLFELPLHSMASDTLEAAIMDLEELANKIKWIKSILEMGTSISNELRPAWRFKEHHASFALN